MPISESGLDGISRFGLRWRYRIYLGHWPTILGDLNDRANDGKPVDDKDVEVAAMGIVARVRETCERHSWAKDTDLDRMADELDAVADCGLTEVNFAMNELYDSFDYWRILAQSEPAAQAIEARRAETGTGSVHESPVAASEPPETPSLASPDDCSTRAGSIEAAAERKE